MLRGDKDDRKRLLGLYEPESQSIYRNYIQRSTVVYDIGGADGDTALTAAKLATQGQVFTFEPDPGLLAKMERNLSLNPGLAARITVVRAFAGDQSLEGRGMPTLRLDEFDGPAPTFVKIDTEGAEAAILQGMVGLLATARPVMYVETHSPELRERCLAFLSQHGYDARLISAWWRPLYFWGRPMHNRWILALPT